MRTATRRATLPDRGSVTAEGTSAPDRSPVDRRRNFATVLANDFLGFFFTFVERIRRTLWDYLCGDSDRRWCGRVGFEGTKRAADGKDIGASPMPFNDFVISDGGDDGINNFGTMANDPADLADDALNATDPFELPIDMRFNEGHLVSIVTYSVLMAISIVGNVTVLVLILKKRSSNRSRINTMLIHLAIADLMVTLLMMPLEIGWAATVTWRAGDAMCRIMAFFRIFGIFLSSFILVCISVDRYYAVLRPLHLMDVAQRGKAMLIGAWSAAVLFSAPQMIIFHVEAHPNITWYEQCITNNAFSTDGHELIYFLFGMVMMYCFPLAVIIYTYSSILLEIYRRSRESGNDRIRRSSLGFLGRAKIRTLKMTIIIVVVFFVCWTPYYFMSVWYWIDRESAKEVDQRIQKGLFLFACTNSCMNPIVYGAFNIRRNTQTPGRAPTIETRVTPVSLSVRLID